MLNRCVWCHEEFEAPTKRARFCSVACKQAHWRAVHNGVRLSAPRQTPPPESPQISEREVNNAVRQLRGAATVLDSASLHGPVKMRSACALVADHVLLALDEAGLL
jgi:hypothetical protein